MKFLIDECLLGKTKSLIKKLGFFVISVVDLGKASAANGEVLSLAKNQEAVLVTSGLHFTNPPLYTEAHSGIIVLRFRASDSPETIDQIHKVLTRLLKEVNPSEIKGNLVIVDRNKYRIHKG